MTLCCDPRCSVCAARGCISENAKAIGGGRLNISEACCLTSRSRRTCHDEHDTRCSVAPPPLPPMQARWETVESRVASVLAPDCQRIHALNLSRTAALKMRRAAQMEHGAVGVEDKAAPWPARAKRAGPSLLHSRCECFSTCTAKKAEHFLDMLPSVVTSRSSAWFGYLSAVYSPPPQLPFETAQLRFFYHNDPLLWPSDVEWPMGTCSMPHVDRRHSPRPGLPSCNASMCARWYGPRDSADDHQHTAKRDSRLDNLIVFGNGMGGSRGSLLIVAGAGPAVQAHDPFYELLTAHAGWRRFGPSGGLAEVMRVDSNACCSYAEGTNRYGVWFYAAPGSGIWLPLGNTLVARSPIPGFALNATWTTNDTIDHAAAAPVRATLRSRRKGHEIWPLYAGGLGFDSVQNLEGCGPTFTPEIVATRAEAMEGPAVRTCTPKLGLRTGPPHAPAAGGCVCNEAEPSLNCAGVGTTRMPRSAITQPPSDGKPRHKVMYVAYTEVKTRAPKCALATGP